MKTSATQELAPCQVERGGEASLQPPSCPSPPPPSPCLQLSSCLVPGCLMNLMNSLHIHQP